MTLASEFDVPDSADEPRRRWEPVGAYVALCAVVMALQQVAYRGAHGGLNSWRDWMPGGFVAHQGRVAWDSGLYLRVAERGYRLGEGLEAGFPGYALAIRLLSHLGLGSASAGVVVTVVSGCGVAVLFWEWMLRNGCSLQQRRIAAAALLLYPWAYVLYGVVYSDAMLLVLVLAAAVFVTRERWVLAGLVAGAATATRPTALVLIPFLVVAALERSGALSVPQTMPVDGRLRSRLSAGWTSLRGMRWNRHRLRPCHLGVLLSLWGVVAYMVFLQRHAGNPILFWSLQDSNYGHGGITDPRTWLKVSMIERPFLEIHTIGDLLNEIAATAAFVSVVACAPAVGRRFGRAYTVLMLALALNVWVFCRWVAPGGRYLLPVVPFLLAWAVGRFPLRSSVRNVVLGCSGVAMFVLAVGFAGVFDLHW
ncbi:MAG: hypothetical protein ACKOYM_09145 [Actinomycetes bacterium]